MATTVHFTSNKSVFLDSLNIAEDRFIGSMAAGIERQIKTSGDTPIDKGALRANTRYEKLTRNTYQVKMLQGYAAAQEIGHRHTKDGTLVEFINHPRGGDKGFFAKAIVTIKSRVSDYANSAFKEIE